MITRRDAIKAISLLGLGVTPFARAAQDWDKPLDELLKQPMLKEEQSGDPTIPLSKVTFETKVVQKASAPTRKLFDKKDPEALAKRMLAISKDFAAKKINRYKDEAQVREYLGLFGHSYEDASLKFCASGVSYAACEAFCELSPEIAYDRGDAFDRQRVSTFQKYMQEIRAYYFFPNPTVAVIRADAIERHTWVSAKVDPKPGWLVIYSWHGKGPNHVGIVEKVDKEKLRTVEYNTGDKDYRNGGVVAEQDRNRNETIMGFVKTY